MTQRTSGSPELLEDSLSRVSGSQRAMVGFFPSSRVSPDYPMPLLQPLSLPGCKSWLCDRGHSGRTLAHKGHLQRLAC